MKLKIPPRIFWNIKGQVPESEQKMIISQAQNQINLLEASMEFQGLQQGRSSRVAGGLLYKATSVFGLRSVAVSMSRGVGVVEEQEKEEKNIICCVVIKRYVMFYNCTKGTCHVPKSYLENFVDLMWENDPEDEVKWMYFKLTDTGNLITFVDDVVGHETEVSTEPSILEIEPVEGTPVIVDSGPMLLIDDWEDTSQGTTVSRGWNTAPDVDYDWGADVCMPQIESRTPHAVDMVVSPNTYKFYPQHVWQYMHSLIKTRRDDTITLNGTNMLPSGWSAGFTGYEVTISDEDGEIDVTHCFGAGGANVDRVNSVCHIHNTHIDGYEYSSMDSGYYVQASYMYYQTQFDWPGNNSFEYYDGRFRNIFLTGILSKTSWHQDMLLYPGVGDVEVGLPSWAPACETSPTVYPPIDVVYLNRTQIMLNTNGTIGHIVGEQKNVDWNWGGESGCAGPGDDMRYECWDIVQPGIDIWEAVPPTHAAGNWCWVLPQIRKTSIHMQGKGYQTHNIIFFDLETETETTFNKDAVNKSVYAAQDTWKQFICSMEGTAQYGFNHWFTAYDGSGEVYESQETFEDHARKYKRQGDDRRLFGQLDDNTMLSFRLISHYNSGWLEYDEDEPDPLTREMTAYSAVRPSDKDTDTEWAEDIVLTETEPWIVDFFVNAAYAVFSHKTLEEFIDNNGWGELQTRFIKIEP